jgi:hypothetical protein
VDEWERFDDPAARDAAGLHVVADPLAGLQHLVVPPVWEADGVDDVLLGLGCR